RPRRAVLTDVGVALGPHRGCCGTTCEAARPQGPRSTIDFANACVRNPAYQRVSSWYALDKALESTSSVDWVEQPRTLVTWRSSSSKGCGMEQTNVATRAEHEAVYRLIMAGWGSQ